MFPYPYVIHHHLVQSGGTEGALDDICNGLGRENCPQSINTMTLSNGIQQAYHSVPGHRHQ